MRLKHHKSVIAHDGHDDKFEIIDFTTASDWETLVSKLENLILKYKNDTSTETSSDTTIVYNGQNYQFIYISQPQKNDKPNCFMDAKNDFLMFSSTKSNDYKYHQVENFSNWFGINRYFLLLALKDSGPELTTVLSTVLSAFVCALHQANCNIPCYVGFGEKRLENFLGYMFAPISRKSDDIFTVKFATESISIQTLNDHQNIAQSIEKQLRIFYSKLSTDSDDRNWEQFLSLSTISTKYTYIRNDWDEMEWRYLDDNGFEQYQQQQQQHQPTISNNNSQSQIMDLNKPKSIHNTNLFSWGFPMDPIEELHFCVMYPPLKSIHILENEIASLQSKSWFIKSNFRKPHRSMFQLSIGVANSFNSLSDSLKTSSIYQILTDYNVRNRFTQSNQEKLISLQQLQSPSNSSNVGNEEDGVANPSLMKTMGSITKTLATSLSSVVIPTEREIDFLLRDLFFEKKSADDPHHFSNISEDLLNSFIHGKNSRIKRAPIDSLLFSFSFVCLSLQSLVGVIVFWSEFVEEIKWHWDNSVPIPRTFYSSTINMNNCLVYQKLHMINYCISRKLKNQSHQAEAESYNQDDSKSTKTAVSSDGWDDDLELDDIDEDGNQIINNNNNSNNNQQPSNLLTLKDQYLLYEDREIVIPESQEFGPMTDDMVQDQLDELMRLGDSSEANEKRLKMQTPSLLSDMQSFKYSNKGCVFEDFIRWHSSRDWISDTQDQGKDQSTPPQKDEPVDPQIESLVNEFGIIEDENSVILDESEGRERKRGFGRDGKLSTRMDKKNIWRTVWQEAKPLPIHQQEQLFDHLKQGQKAIEYLETINPTELIYQIQGIILTSIPIIFSNEKSVNSNLPNEFCLGINSPHTKQIIDSYLDTLNSTYPIYTPKEIKKNEFDPIIKSIQDIENSISKFTSLKSKFKNLDRIINNLYVDGYSDVKETEHPLVSELMFGEEDDATTVPPSIKEYITRSYAPRPFRDSQTMPHRMYTCLSTYECRVSTLITEQDQY